MSKFNAGDKTWIIESAIFVVEVEVVRYSGGLYLIRYPNKTGGYKVKESRLYKTEAEAQLAADISKPTKSKYSKY